MMLTLPNLIKKKELFLKTPDIIHFILSLPTAVSDTAFYKVTCFPMRSPALAEI